jgi:hypothetical protein
MPANRLTVSSREIRNLTAENNSGTINISGDYKITIENGGILPVPGVSVQVNSVKPVKSSYTFLEDKTQNVGDISGGDTSSVSFKFEVSGPEPDLLNVAQSACEKREVETSVNEALYGLLLGVTSETQEYITVTSPSCSLNQSQNELDQPDQTESPVNRSPDDSQQDIDYSMEISGPADVTQGTQRSWNATPSNASSSEVTFEFDMGDGTSINSDNGEVSYTYSNVGNYTILARMYEQQSGNEVDVQTKSVNVNPSPEPSGNVGINITDSYVDYEGAGQVGIEYIVNNQSSESRTLNIERLISGNWIGGNEQTIGANSSYDSSYTIGYDGPGEYELGIRVNGQTETETVTADGNGTEQDNNQQDDEENQGDRQDNEDGNQQDNQQPDNNLSQNQLDIVRRWDFKNDGVIDQDEVDHAAMRANNGRITSDEFTIIQTVNNRGTEFDPVGKTTAEAVRNRDSMAVYDLHEELIRNADTNSDSELSATEVDRISQDSNLSGEQEEALGYFSGTGYMFPENRNLAEGIRKYKDVIAEFDLQNTGRISQSDLEQAEVAANNGEITQNEIVVLRTFQSRNVRFPQTLESNL